MVRILLVAAQKAMVQQLVQAAEAAKLRPVGVDLVPFAIVRSVGLIDGSGLHGAEGGDEAIVDIGADVTSICVHAWGVPRFVRILPTGGRDVTTAVARALSISEGEAEKLKRGYGSETESKLVEASRAAVDRAATFADEIRSSIEFYLSKMP